MQACFRKLSQIVLCVILTPHLFQFIEQCDAANEYRCDFRNSHFDNNVLMPVSAGTVKLIRPDKNGLVMSAPAGRMLPFVGISPRTVLKGDFVITASYTLPRVRYPADGYGAGPTLYIATHSEESTAANIGRLLRTNNASVYSTNVASTIAGDRQQKVRLFPTESLSGKLRLVRMGDKLKFLVASENQTTFQELREEEFTTADIMMVRLGIQQSDAATPVEAIWHDLRIQADKLVGGADDVEQMVKRHVPSYNKAPEPERISLWWSAGAGLILIGLLTVVYRYRRSG